DQEEKEEKRQTTVAVLSLGAILFLTALDVTIISTAVPRIADEFGSALGYTWVGSAYVLAHAAVVPVWGRMSDIFGRKPVVLAALAAFALGSLLCGVAVSMAMLLAGRAAQGVGAGGVLTLVYVCISDLFLLRDRPFYFGVMGLVWVLASAIGPVLGGVFTGLLTWRWCFYINLPICAIGFIAIPLALKLDNHRTPLRQGLLAIDWIGSSTVVGGTIVLLLGLELGSVTGRWNSPIVLGLVLSGVSLLGLACVHFSLPRLTRTRYPLIPLSLFANRSNCAAFGVAFMHGFVLISASYWLPLYFQAVLGATAFQSGVYLLPYALSLSLTSAAAGWAIRKTGSYLWLVISAMAVTVLGFGLLVDLSLEPTIPIKAILYQLVAGAGIGPNSQATLIAIQTAIPPQETAAATSMFIFTRQMATAISIVIGGAVFSSEMQRQSEAIAAAFGPGSDLADMLSGRHAAANAGRVAQLVGDEGDVAREAYSIALRHMRIVYAACAGAGLLLSVFIRHRRLSEEEPEH
ncbi:major facilitator superfamily-domain-containing protein, partial [Lasiosphaeria miniovina]